MGIPKLLTVLVGAILTVVLGVFIKKNDLNTYFGLCKTSGSSKNWLYYIPLIVISSVNLWNGIVIEAELMEIVLFVISMCFVGILEEIIFRGFLFKGMCKSNVTSAIIVSSLTFGAGHIVNLLLGSPVMETLLQLIYASAIGFCYTVIFYVSSSIYPCILSHVVVNATSIFAPQLSSEKQIMIAAIQTVLGVGYGIWLLKKSKE